MRAPRWASAAQLRPRTVRMRLTALYGAMFLLCGAALLTITYLLVEHSTGDVLTYRSSDGKTVGAIAHLPSHPPPVAAGTLRTPAGTETLSPKQMLAEAVRMRRLALQQHAQTMHTLLFDSGIALAAMTILSIGLGWFVAGRVLRPLRTITAAARDISATNLHRRLALGGPRDELTELGDTFDGLLTRLDTAFQAQRQFVANASHELRTPLARQRAIGQVALGDPDATLESLRGAHERILAAGVQQERLIAALLALSRGQTGVVRNEPVDLAEVMAGVLETREPDVLVAGVEVEATLESAWTNGDPRLIETLIANLVDNALRHNSASDGRVSVRTATSHGRARLVVTNTGPRVPDSELDRLVEPFHRVSGERGARGDGLGLGLSIVQAVVDAHGATLTVGAQSVGGLRVEVAFAATVACGSVRKTDAVGVGDRLCAVAAAGLREDVIDVRFDRRLADEQVGGDLGVRLTGRDQR